MVMLCLVAAPLSAQVAEAALTKLFPQRQSASVFTVRPGVQVEAIYGAPGEACVLTIKGDVSESEVMHIFDLVVPPKSRGAKKGDVVWCAGPCQHLLSYGRVTFATGVMGEYQTSEPAAILVFQDTRCKHAAEEAKRIVLNVRQRPQVTRK
jgi:hypothetical protein